MKDPCDDIRDWFYASLNGYLTYGGVAVPVYSFPPQATTPVTAPYVVIGEHSAEIETGAKDTYMWDVVDADIKQLRAWANVRAGILKKKSKSFKVVDR